MQDNIKSADKIEELYFQIDQLNQALDKIIAAVTIIVDGSDEESEEYIKSIVKWFDTLKEQDRSKFNDLVDSIIEKRNK